MPSNFRLIIFALLWVLLAGSADALCGDASAHGEHNVLVDASAALSARIAELIAEVEKDVGDVPVQQVEDLRRADRSGLILVDARSQAERDVSLIAGAVALVELEKLRPIPNIRVVVYCTIGLRSGQAVRALRARGFDAFNLRGGVLAWLAAGGAMVDTKGKPTQRVHVYGTRWNAVPTSFIPVW